MEALVYPIMNALLRTIQVSALALLLQGCTATEWAKSGADNATVQGDLNECREVALRRAPPPVIASGSADPRSDPARGFGGMSPASASNERHVAEQEEIRRCMLKRGYEMRRTS